MPQTMILKGQVYAFAGGVIPANISVSTLNPATGSITYILTAHGPAVIPLPGKQVFQFTLPVNGNTLTIVNNTTGGLVCIY